MVITGSSGGGGGTCGRRGELKHSRNEIGVRIVEVEEDHSYRVHIRGRS